VALVSGFKRGFRMEFEMEFAVRFEGVVMDCFESGFEAVQLL
jgi:hypothetical protein